MSAYCSKADLPSVGSSKADVVMLYLLPSLNVKLIPQLEKLRPGSRIVSHAFDMRGVKPKQVVKVNCKDGIQLAETNSDFLDVVGGMNARSGVFSPNRHLLVLRISRCFGAGATDHPYHRDGVSVTSIQMRMSMTVI